MKEISHVSISREASEKPAWDNGQPVLMHMAAPPFLFVFFSEPVSG